MGTWGTGLFDDDLAADVRDDFRELVAEGLTLDKATDHLLREYSGAVLDSDEGPVFWLALADTQWKLGRLDKRVKSEALRVISDGSRPRCSATIEMTFSSIS